RSVHRGPPPPLALSGPTPAPPAGALARLSEAGNLPLSVATNTVGGPWRQAIARSARITPTVGRLVHAMWSARRPRRWLRSRPGGRAAPGTRGRPRARPPRRGRTRPPGRRRAPTPHPRAPPARRPRRRPDRRRRARARPPAPGPAAHRRPPAPG